MGVTGIGHPCKQAYFPAGGSTGGSTVRSGRVPNRVEALKSAARGRSLDGLMNRLVLAAAVIAALAFVSSATADALPTPGTTTTTVCFFDARAALDLDLAPGATYCRQEINIVIALDCVEDGYRLYEFDLIASARTYRGNVVLPGLNGVQVEGDYSDVVRPNANLFYDSGPHGTGYQTLVADESCNA
jgi:hypothetical protein